MSNDDVKLTCPFCASDFVVDANYYREVDRLCCPHCNKAYDLNSVMDAYDWNDGDF